MTVKSDAFTPRITSEQSFFCCNLGQRHLNPSVSIRLYPGYPALKRYDIDRSTLFTIIVAVYANKKQARETGFPPICIQKFPLREES